MPKLASQKIHHERSASLAGSRSTRPPFVRMLRIHELLSAGRSPNCSVLARDFEVSVKTVQRDIDFMRDQLMLPIEYDRYEHGFFYSQPVGQFPLITVSEGEVVALLVAQKAAEQYRGTPFEKPLQSAFQKLVSSLPGETSISLHELSEAVSFHSAGVPKNQIRIFELLAEAVRANHLVEFDYLSLRASKPERRRLAPYHLASINNQWYVIGADQLRGQLRTFALTRIAGVKTLKTPFERPKDFSVAKMLSGSFAAFQAARTEQVKIRFDGFAARLVRERQWHVSQRMRPTEAGGIELTMRVGVAPDLESWILGWGDHAEVIEPAELRERICATIGKMAAKYQLAAERHSAGPDS
jgi:predicted DNA-binding transcriptional regulator YafY